MPSPLLPVWLKVHFSPLYHPEVLFLSVLRICRLVVFHTPHHQQGVAVNLSTRLPPTHQPGCRHPSTGLPAPCQPGCGQPSNRFAGNPATRLPQPATRQPSNRPQPVRTPRERGGRTWQRHGSGRAVSWQQHGSDMAASGRGHGIDMAASRRTGTGTGRVGTEAKEIGQVRSHRVSSTLDYASCPGGATLGAASPETQRT